MLFVMHHLHGFAARVLLGGAPLFIGSCNAEPAPAAPTVQAARARRGEPIADYVVAAFADS